MSVLFCMDAVNFVRLDALELYAQKYKGEKNQSLKGYGPNGYTYFFMNYHL